MRSIFGPAAVALLAAQILVAQEKDLTSLSLEDFLNVEVVSVDKTRQKLSRSAAAVFVITQDDIRRSGATCLPEVLRLVPGVHVAHVAGSEWSVSIRGFSGIYANKLLVMIDGRPVYNALLSGTLWGENFMVLEDIERIEVIRGPGATMWGANAVSGVINVITKTAQATKGGMAAVSAGTSDPARARVRYGGGAGPDAAWRGWVQYGLNGQPKVPGLPGTLDPWTDGRGGVRLDWNIGKSDSLLVEGEVQRNGGPTPLTGAAQPGSFLLNVVDSSTAGGYVMGRWTHTNRRGDETSLQVSDTNDHIRATVFAAEINTLDLDFQHTMHLSAGHTLTAGGGGRLNAIETAGTAALSFSPASRNYHVVNGFLQDEWELKPDRLILTAGAKVEDYTLAGTSLEPTARLMWTPTARQGYWVAVSRAVRTPAHTDYAVRLLISPPGLPLPLELMGSDQFQPEVLNAFETGTRFRVHRSWAFDVTVFRHQYSGLYSYALPFSSTGGLAPVVLGTPGDPIPVIPAVTANALNGVNQGAEGVVYFDVRRGWQLSGSYSSLFAGTTFRPGYNAQNSFALPTSSPKHQWQVRSSWDVMRHWTADLAFYRTGALPDGTLPGYTRLDCRFGRSLGESAEISVSGQNLLRPYQREVASNILWASGLAPRAVELSLRWNF
jgi:iron complex outermembrane receptor protein